MKHGTNICIAMIAFVATACTQRTNAWEDLNYNSVYRRAAWLENDAFYTPPAVNCMENGFYNCQ